MQDFITQFVGNHGYEAIFSLMVLESACIPIPSEVTMLFGGALATEAVASSLGVAPLNLVVVALVGTLGYHRGERLAIVRNEDGMIRNLECATFVYTRRPYDPDVPIPGGHPRRG